MPDISPSATLDRLVVGHETRDLKVVTAERLASRVVDPAGAWHYVPFDGGSGFVYEATRPENDRFHQMLIHTSAPVLPYRNDACSVEVDGRRWVMREIEGDPWAAAYHSQRGSHVSVLTGENLRS